MPKPTIDQMITWVKGQWTMAQFPDNDVMHEAVITILAQHRDPPRSLGEGISSGLLLVHPRDIERGKLEVIQEFAKEVHLRAHKLSDQSWDEPNRFYYQALCEVEKELCDIDAARETK
jgi:hypothetical protein